MDVKCIKTEPVEHHLPSCPVSVDPEFQVKEEVKEESDLADIKEILDNYVCDDVRNGLDNKLTKKHNRFVTLHRENGKYCLQLRNICCANR